MQVRRLSTAPAARLGLQRLWRSAPPLAELPELKTLRTLQRLVERAPERPEPSLLLQGEDFRQWVDEFRSSRGIAGSGALVDKEAFDELFQGAEAQIRAKEDAALQTQAPIEALEEEQLKEAEASEFVEAIKLKLARHMCAQAGRAFELLDKDKDGKVLGEDVERLLRVVEQGNTPEWLRSQFQLHDANSDDAVNETESKQILDSIISVQKTVLTELFEKHVANMPKKHMKLVAKGINEEDWKSKIPEKVRCVYHFADKVEDESEIDPPKDKTAKTVHWEIFRETQEAELPELHNMLGVYAKGIHDYRYEFHERQREKRSTRNKGLALAVAIGVGDFIATLV